MIRESWRQSLKIEKLVRTRQGEPWPQELLQIINIDGIQSDSSWGRRSGRGRAACSGSTHAQWRSPGGSRGKDGQPRRLNVVSLHLSECRCTHTVVALLSLGAVTAHVAETTA